MPFGVGPFGTTYNESLPTTKAQIPSSRNIDAFGRFTQEADADAGGFDGMSDNMQRALVLLGLNYRRPEKFVADFVNKTTADIAQALAPLNGAVEIEAIDVSEDGVKLATHVIKLRDLQDNSVKIWKPRTA